MTRTGVIAVVLSGAIATANAAPVCYHANEIEAEQAMRYQAKLMVLSDSCRSNSYGQFVNQNGPAIKAYQAQLISYYRRTDSRHAEDAFDRFLTRLANQEALAAGAQNTATLCGKSQEFLAQAIHWGKEEFRRFVSQQADAERKSYPACTE